MLPTSPQTIDQVHQLANDDNQPNMSDNLLVFETTPGVILQFDAQDGSDELHKDKNASISTRDDGDAEMMANLALENNHALISKESDDMPTKDETRDKDENQSHATQEEDDNSVMSDDYSFNLQNMVESENSDENTTIDETSQSDDVTTKSSEASQASSVAIE